MDRATCFEPRSPFFDAPLSPPLFFPTDAEHELDPFTSFDEQQLSSPDDLLTPASNTDSSNESIDLLPVYSATEHTLTTALGPSSARQQRSSAAAIYEPSPFTDAHALIPATSSSSSTSSLASPEQSNPLSMTVYSGPTAPRTTGPVELVFHCRP